MGRESMIFYRSFYESGMLLKSKDRVSLFEAILGYQFGDEPVALTDAARAAWVLIRPVLESNNRRYENGQKGKEHGIKGGRPIKKNPCGDTDGGTDSNPAGVTDDDEKETPDKDKEEEEDKDKDKIER